MLRFLAITNLTMLSLFSNIHAHVPVAVYDPISNTLAFSVVKKESADEYSSMELLKGRYWQGDDVVNVKESPKWNIFKDDIQTVVFNRTFSECKPKSTQGWFSSFRNLTSIEGIENLNTSDVTNMNSMFYSCTSLERIDVSKFNTSKVTDMGFMFYHCESVKSLNLSGFDTSNVTTMTNMFAGCYNIPYIDVSQFNTSKVRLFVQMFNCCYNIQALDLTNFNTGSLECCNFMFKECRQLHTDVDSRGALFGTGRPNTKNAPSSCGKCEDRQAFFTMLCRNTIMPWGISLTNRKNPLE